MVVEITAKLGVRPAKSSAELYASVLSGFYRSLLDIGIPPHLATLVQRLEEASGTPQKVRTRALVVEPDEADRDAAIALLQGSGLDVTGCTRAREAIEYLRARGDDTAFVFCDEVLAGRRDGVELVETITVLWPGIRVVLMANERTEPPPGVSRLLKPWKALDLLVEVKHALGGAQLHP